MAINKITSHRAILVEILHIFFLPVHRDKIGQINHFFQPYKLVLSVFFIEMFEILKLMEKMRPFYTAIPLFRFADFSQKI
jgi:hypothetical protein